MNIVLAVAAFALLEWFNFRAHYRSDIAVSNERKRRLFILQTVVLALLVVPIADIDIPFSCTRTRPATTAVVLDDSFSMRRNYDVRTLTNDLARFCAGMRGIEVYDADSFVRRHGEPLFLRAGDHHALFSFLADARPSSAVVISDGEGMAAFPGLTNMFMVRPSVRPFIAVSGIVPRSLREGEDAELLYVIAYRGAVQAAEFSLQENGRVYTSFPLRLTGETNMRKRVRYRPHRSAEALLTASVKSSADDTAIEDNTRSDIVTVERGSTAVMLISGGPTKDMGMLKTFLSGDASIRLSSYGIGETARPDACDLVIIVDPTRDMAVRSAAALTAALARGTPFIILYSTRGEEVPGFSGLFPAAVRRGGKLALSPADNASMLCRIGVSDAENEARWRSMTMFDTLFIPDRELTPLVLAGDAPAVSTASAGRSRVVYVGCAPLWRLKLFGTAVGVSGLYDTFVSTMVNELTRPSFGSMAVSDRTVDVGGAVRIRLRPGSAGVISAFYRDAVSNTNHISAAAIDAVRGSVMSVKAVSPLAVTFMSPGICTLRFENGAVREDVIVAVNPPYSEIVSAPGAMASIASNTGGAYFTVLDDVRRALKPVTVKELRSFTVSSWRNWTYLMVTVLACLLLWVMKRRYGLY